MIPICAWGNDPPEGSLGQTSDYTGGDCGIWGTNAGKLAGAGAEECLRLYPSKGGYNFCMRALIAACFLLLLIGQGQTQVKTATSAPKVVTVPATIDHNRVIIRADHRLPDGSTQSVGAWVDNGNPELYLSRRVA